jgi:choline dehydrogenase-like flavoprotein
MTAPAVLKAFSELQLSFLQPHCSCPSHFDGEADQVQHDVFQYLDTVPPLIRDAITLVLDHIELAALSIRQKSFAVLSNPERKDVLDRLAASGSYDEVSLLARLTWLITYSRPAARDCICFTQPPDPAGGLADPRPQPPLPTLDHEYDVCIIGSGAGGALVAARLHEEGREVLLIDEGKWVEPRNYPVRDDLALSQLFRDSGLQPALPDIPHIPQRSGLSFMTVLQARLFGGGPAINNAIHLPITQRRWSIWRNTYDFPVEWADLATALAQVEKDLGVGTPGTIEMRKAIGDRSLAVEAGAKSLGWIVGDLPVAAHDCIGCGGCNAGCRFGLKTGGLHNTRAADRPRSYLQKAYDAKVAMRPELRAIRFVTTLGSRKVASLTCQDLSSGHPQEVNVRARTFVLAAGPVASSQLLHRSGIQILSPVGKHIAANVVLPVFALLDKPIPKGKNNPGLEMCVYVDQGGRLLESWFHYPGSLAAAIPGWLDEHVDIMTQYPRLACCGVVVPTGNRGLIAWPHEQIVMSLSADELDQMKDGVASVADLFFAAGAEKVIPGTRISSIINKTTADADKATFRQSIRGPADFSLSTAHPQGGNALGRDPLRSVVSPKFTLFDFNNVFVADASLFPAGCGVNPQMTTMALAHLACDAILDN